uniref:Uncharacterized protein n=1 Tax=Anguilla anguilla TaxID=7936 RepID=A0A0E9TAB1_ANGAN
MQYHQLMAPLWCVKHLQLLISCFKRLNIQCYFDVFCMLSTHDNPSTFGDVLGIFEHVY